MTDRVRWKKYFEVLCWDADGGADPSAEERRALWAATQGDNLIWRSRVLPSATTAGIVVGDRSSVSSNRFGQITAQRAF